MYNLAHLLLAINTCFGTCKPMHLCSDSSLRESLKLVFCSHCEDLVTCNDVVVCWRRMVYFSGLTIKLIHTYHIRSNTSSGSDAKQLSYYLTWEKVIWRIYFYIYIDRIFSAVLYSDRKRKSSSANSTRTVEIDLFIYANIFRDRILPASVSGQNPKGGKTSKESSLFQQSFESCCGNQFFYSQWCTVCTARYAILRPPS